MTTGPGGRLLAFGEIMLRLSPPARELLLQTPVLQVWVAGAEANVVIQLARLGHDVALASRVPNNALGHAAVDALRGHGVDVSAVDFFGDRMGLYFATPGTGVRVTDVFYDRAGSSFASAPADAWQWEMLLDGIDRLHLSGVTPALGPVSAESTVAAAEAAQARGIPVSFDGNWRGKLWARWDGDARSILTRIVENVDLLFGNHRDIALLLGRPCAIRNDTEHARVAAEEAFAAFPRLKMIASTTRTTIAADHHRLVGRIDLRERSVQTDEVDVTGIVDRIGTGDAFAAGVLHVLRSGGSFEEAAGTGIALAALKHSVPGDISAFNRADLAAYFSGSRDLSR